MRVGNIVVLLLLCLACAKVRHALALTWRIFSTTSDCVSTYVDGRQWSMLQSSKTTSKENTPDGLKADITIDYGFIATTSKNGEKVPADIDVWVKSPDGQIVHSEESLSEKEMSLTVWGHQGPWQLCFKQRSENGRWRPSAQINLSYFDADVADYKDTVFPPFTREFTAKDIQAPDSPLKDMLSGVESLPTAKHVNTVFESLMVLDRQLRAVNHEQMHFQHRTEWHLETLQKSHRSMLWWALIQIAALLAAAGCQVTFIRKLFTGQKGYGHIPMYR